MSQQGLKRAADRENVSNTALVSCRRSASEDVRASRRGPEGSGSCARLLTSQGVERSQSTFWRLCPRITEHIEKKTWIFYGLDTEENGKIGVEVKAQGAFFAAAGYEIVKLPNLKFDTTFPCLQRRSKCTQRSPHIHLPDWEV